MNRRFVNRYMATVVLACLGIATIISLHGSPRVAAVLARLNPEGTATAVVEEFYQAISRGDIHKAQALTAESYWRTLEQQGEIKSWQELFGDPARLSLKGFTVINSTQAGDEAIVEGRAEWVSQSGKVPQAIQTINLRREQSGWRIYLIRNKEYTGTVETFYYYLSLGQLEKAKALLEPQLWQTLQKQGIINKLASGAWKMLDCKVLSTGEFSNTAAVQIELTWLNPKEVRTNASLSLAKSKDTWAIAKIAGGWPR
ncbi:MAG TPA: hypothetical protein VHQ46_01115 [Desulfobacteria bacterium]|nr:hypothetical protein [Desulfobacteria bacterium]